MVADFGLNAAGARSQRSRQRCPSSERSWPSRLRPHPVVAYRGWGTTGQTPLAAFGYLRPLQSTWPRLRWEGAHRWAPSAGNSVLEAEGAHSWLRARAQAQSMSNQAQVGPEFCCTKANTTGERKGGAYNTEPLLQVEIQFRHSDPVDPTFLSTNQHITLFYVFLSKDTLLNIVDSLTLSSPHTAL